MQLMEFIDILNHQKEFPSWIKPQNYFKRRVQKNLSGEEVLIKVNDELKK